MTFLGIFLLSFFFILHSRRAENISTILHARKAFENKKEVFNTVSEQHRNELQRVLFTADEDIVPNVFIVNGINSQNLRQERAIDHIPPHKAFHEFHHEPVRPRVPGQRPRPTRPSDTAAPRRFPEDQQTFDERLKPTSSTRTRRPGTTVRYPLSDSQTKKTRPTSGPSTTIRRRPTSDSSTTTRRRPTSGPSGTTRRRPTSGSTSTARRPTSGPSGTTRRRPTSGSTSTTKRRPTSGSSSTTRRRPTRPSKVTDTLPNGRGLTRRRPTSQPDISDRPFRTSGAARGTRRPDSTKPSGQFPPHKDFHDFHHEPIKPRRPGTRRRTTSSPRATRPPDQPVTVIPGTTTVSRELTTYPSEGSRMSFPDSSITSRPRKQSRVPSGRRVTQGRKATSVATRRTTKFPEGRVPADKRPGFDPRITPTPRFGVTRRHTDNGRRRTKRPTSIPSEFTRSATHSQSVSSKSLPPHKAFHDFHFDPGQAKVPDSKTPTIPSERTTPILPTAATRRTKQPRIPGERSTQRPRAGRTRFANGIHPTTAQGRQTPSGRRRTSIKPRISSEKPFIDQKITTHESRSFSTPRQRTPSKHPQPDFDVTQRVKPSSPSPRRLPEDTSGSATSRPLPPHKAFHEFHLQPVRPRLPGSRRTNGIPIRTPRPDLPSQYPNGDSITQKLRPTPSVPQNIWPRIPDGDSFITQRPIFSTARPGINLDTKRPGTSSRFTIHQRPGPTTTTRKQSTPSRRPGGKRRKPTARTKPPDPYKIPEEEKSFSISQTPFQPSVDNRKKPSRGTKPPRTTALSNTGGPSMTSRPLPPHKAFHDFHFEPVTPSRYPGGHSGTTKPTLRHGIQPRIPDGDHKVITPGAGVSYSTQKPATSRRRPNGKRRKPTSGTKRPSTQHRRPSGRGPVPGTQPDYPASEKPIDTQITKRQPEYQPSEPPSKTLVTPDIQIQRTQPKFPSDRRPETTPSFLRPRTKPRFPGDRGAQPTASTFPEDGRRPTRPRIPFDTGSTEQPIKIPPHKAFHEFHYAPVRPRFLAGT